jgi:hypothetical protein
MEPYIYFVICYHSPLSGLLLVGYCLPRTHILALSINTSLLKANKPIIWSINETHDLSTNIMLWRVFFTLDRFYSTNVISFVEVRPSFLNGAFFFSASDQLHVSLPLLHSLYDEFVTLVFFDKADICWTNVDLRLSSQERK